MSPGDYLVSNTPAREDCYGVSAERFAAMYEPDHHFGRNPPFLRQAAANCSQAFLYEFYLRASHVIN